MINNNDWGGITVSSNPKKTTAVMKIDDNGNVISVEEHSDATNKSRLQRLQEGRAKKLGMK